MPRIRLTYSSDDETRSLQAEIDENVHKLSEYYSDLAETIGKTEADDAFCQILKGIAEIKIDEPSQANRAAFEAAGFAFTPATRMINVKQPWAYGLVAGIKDVENRSYELPTLPVQVLIVASKSRPTAENAAKYRANGGEEAPYDFQAIIGAVEFSACVLERVRVCYNRGGRGWVVSKHVLFPHPIRDVPGKLGLLYVKNLEPGLHARILKELGF